MKTEKEKMLSGELYNPLDEELSGERKRARLLFQQLNKTTDNETEKREQLLRELIPNSGEKFWVEPPFFCDYGKHITAGDRVFINYNTVILDVMPVRIGSRTLIAPNVQIYTATHPMDYKIRAKWLEFAKPVTIGKDVWIGGNATICPGVTIGDRTVIGAGSVVTKDIPSDVFAAGNPCKIIRKINKE